MILSYILIISVIILLVLDCLTTLDIKNHADLHETNLILGQHPTDTKIILYFLICMIVFCMGALLLLEPFCYIWISVWTVVEIYCLFNNFKLGLKI